MIHELDTTGLLCPYPLAKAKKALKSLIAGDKLKVISTDPASQIDFKVFAEVSDDVILEYDHHDVSKNQYIFVLTVL